MIIAATVFVARLSLNSEEGMRLFSKLFGSRDMLATPTFDLAAQEKLEVDMIFNLLKCYAVHPGVADKLALIADDHFPAVFRSSP